MSTLTKHFAAALTESPDSGVSISLQAPNRAGILAALSLLKIDATPASVAAPTPTVPAKSARAKYNNGVAAARSLVASLIAQRQTIEAETPRAFTSGYSLDQLEAALRSLNETKTFKGEGELFEGDKIDSPRV